MDFGLCHQYHQTAFYRVERPQEILTSLPRTRTRVAVKNRRKVLGKIVPRLLACRELTASSAPYKSVFGTPIPSRAFASVPASTVLWTTFGASPPCSHSAPPRLPSCYPSRRQPSTPATVDDALRAVGQRFARMGARDIRKTSTGNV
jgi:hypothetical protein